MNEAAPMTEIRRLAGSEVSSLLAHTDSLPFQSYPEVADASGLGVKRTENTGTSRHDHYRLFILALSVGESSRWVYQAIETPELLDYRTPSAPCLVQTCYFPACNVRLHFEPNGITDQSHSAHLTIQSLATDGFKL